MGFEVICAIDLSKGEVVRVLQGDLARKTVYATDPVAVAERWRSLGAPRLHVVDLDGAVSGEPRHAAVVARIVERIDVPVQVAGGIRSIDSARAWLDAGADRVVIGTKALTDDAFLAEAVSAFGPRLVVAADARDREIRVSGWREGSGEDVVDAARRMATAGVPRLLVTDVGRDGMLTGPAVELYAELVQAAGVPVIASGGVSGPGDLRALARMDGVEGAVVGRALYTGDLDLRDALEAVA